MVSTWKFCETSIQLKCLRFLDSIPAVNRQPGHRRGTDEAASFIQHHLEIQSIFNQFLKIFIKNIMILKIVFKYFSELKMKFLASICSSYVPSNLKNIIISIFEKLMTKAGSHQKLTFMKMPSRTKT